MFQIRKAISKKGTAAVVVLFAAMLCLSGCGKADKAYNKAMELAEEGEYEEAAEEFQTAIKENGDKAEYYIAYGMTLNHMGEYKDALKQFEKAYQEVDNKISRKNNKQLYYGEAVAYYSLHQFDKAIDCCEKALKIKEQSEINGSIYVTMAVSQWVSGDSENALDSLNQLIKDNKEDIRGYLQRGQLYLNMGDSEAAVSDFAKAIELDSKCYDAYFKMYDAYMAAGQQDAAIESLETVTEMEAKSAEQKMQVGRAYCILGQEDRAVSYLEDAVQGECSEGNYYLGTLQMKKQEYQKALGYFENYIQNTVPVTLPEVYNQIAGCLIELEEYDRALKYIEQGLELGVTEAYQGLLRNQVILLERMQKFSQALEAAEAYLQAFPEDAAMKKESEFIKTRIKKKKPAATGKPSALPESGASESDLSEPAEPESSASESGVPESDEPESSASESGVPESDEPESSASESSVPEEESYD